MGSSTSQCRREMAEVVLEMCRQRSSRTFTLPRPAMLFMCLHCRIESNNHAVFDRACELLRYFQPKRAKCVYSNGVLRCVVNCVTSAWSSIAERPASAICLRTV